MSEMMTIPERTLSNALHYKKDNMFNIYLFT